MSFVIRQKMTLETLGEGWEQAYIIYSPAKYSDKSKLLEINKLRKKVLSGDPEAIAQANDMTFNIVKENFIEGQGFDGSKLVPITKENLGDLPETVLTDLFLSLTGALDLKKKSSLVT